MPRIAERAPADPEHAAAPVPTRGRRATSARSNRASNSVELNAFPGWARQPDATVAPAAATFAAGAALALFDRMLRAGPDGVEPPYAGVMHQRLALKAAASCARLARLRED
ncbi:DUF1403 family protein [Methylosinus sp. PW1]|uniref:DUF1403 family protein n=1 Tax=Methylosinus sp. PW1 TaxID=107636 RepID=UPI00068D11BA|nr:DUF1403 family protein [Methylosinus sp. PW1]